MVPILMSKSLTRLANLLLSKWYIILPWLLLLIAFIYHDITLNSKKNDISILRAELVKQKGLYEVAQNLYEGMALEVTDLITKNDSLIDYLNDNGQKIKYLASLNLQYKTKIDSLLSISTTEAINDTFSYGTTVIIKDSTDREFKYRYNGELYVEGFFNTYDPYNLFLTNVQLDAEIDVAVSQDRNGFWSWNVDTHSDLLVPKAVEVQINPRSSPWEGFYGVNIISNSFNILSPTGIGLHGGVKKGNYAGQLDIRTIDEGGTYVGAGITKYFEF